MLMHLFAFLSVKSLFIYSDTTAHHNHQALRIKQLQLEGY